MFCSRVRARAHVYFAASGANSGPAGAEKLSVLGSTRELERPHSQGGFVSPHGHQVQKKDTEAGGGADAPPADCNLSGRSSLPGTPDCRAPSSAGECSAFRSPIPCAKTIPVAAPPQGLAEANPNESGPLGTDGTSAIVLEPVDIPSRRANDDAEPEAPPSHKSGVKEPISKAADVPDPDAGPASPATSTKSCMLHSTEVPPDVSVRLHAGGSGRHQADKDEHAPLSFLCDGPFPSVAPASREGPREGSQGWQQQSASQSTKELGRQGQDISALPTAGEGLKQHF